MNIIPQIEQDIKIFVKYSRYNFYNFLRSQKLKRKNSFHVDIKEGHNILTQ